MNGHSLHYENEKIVITGVTEVKSFSDKEVILTLAEGGLTVKGNALNVSELTVAEGKVEIEGRLNSLTYSGTTAEKGNILKKLFK